MSYLKYFCIIATGLGLMNNTVEAVENRISLRVSGLPNPSQTDPVSTAAQRVAERFLELNPDIELVPAEGIRIDTVPSEVTTIMMISGDIAPDVLTMNFRSVDTFVSQGMVEPLDAYVAKEEARGGNVQDRILPQIRDVVYRPNAKGERHLYGLPEEMLVTGIYFNRELFLRADLPERAPKDWKELEEFAAKITALGPGYKGIHLRGGAQASWNLMNFLWSAGGDAVEEIAPNEWRATFNTDAAVEAYEFYYKLVEIERTALKTTQLTDLDRERVGMTFGYVGGTTTADPERFGFGAVPKGPTGLRGAEVNSVLLGIYSQIKDPAVKEAAWRYVLFMTGPEAEHIRVKTLVDLGQGSVVNPVSLRKFGYEQFLGLSPRGLEEEFVEALKSGKPEPYGKNCNLVYQEMTYPLDQILLSREIHAAWLGNDMETVRWQIKAILDSAVQRTNERMIGYVSPDEMAFRRKVAGAVVAAILIVFLFVGWYISRVFSQAAAATIRPVAGRGLLPWLCLLPAIVLMLAWSYLPLIRGTGMAFLDYQLIFPSTFVGLDNFALTLFDPSFWNAIVATLHFALYTLTFGFAAPILLAYGLHIIPKYKILYRTVYYLPAVISTVAVFFLWRELFGAEGPLNLALRFLGFEGRRAWTDDPYLAMLSCVIPGIWATAGPGCLIYLAALKTIPTEQFEASEIDGAGFLQKTVVIIWPGLRALILINFIGAVAAAFHGATNILIMTGGGPNGMTEVASLKIFFEAFTRLRFGPATAMAWIIGSMLIGLTVLQLKRLSQMEFKTAK